MRIALSAALAICLGGSAMASSSAWNETEGGAVRLVTTGKPSSDGTLRGVLDIRLKPGWKTYWRDPGGSGVPPTLDIGQSGTAIMDFPAPEWHHDGSSDWAGYQRSIALPVTYSLKQGGPIKAAVFLGVCETICVPLQAELTIDPLADADNPDDAALVQNANLLLPKPATPELGVTAVREVNGALEISANLGDAEAAELFLAGDGGYMFGRPHLKINAGKALFAVKLVTKPKSKPQGPGLHYTLTTKSGAVSGLVPYF